MSMNVGNVNQTAPGGGQNETTAARTREACRQFEGLLLGMILKSSLASPESGEEQSAGAGLMKEFASEQLAQSLSDSGGIGIADMLQIQLNNRGNTTL